MIVNAFSGAGGWEEGARLLGFHEEIVGIEWMPEAVATARAGGHVVVEGSVADSIPDALGAVGFIASPPCQAFSSGGKRLGRHDLPIIYEALEFLLMRDPSEQRDPLPESFAERCLDPRSILVVEPLRWILALQPEWVALEQVPAVAPLWRWLADVLEQLGYSCWTGMLYAEEYGVPQTRKRAILIASRTRAVGVPPESHQGYNPRSKGPKKGTEHREPYVTMAEALGWGMTARPYPTIACSRTSGGPDREKVGGSAARANIYAEQAAGRWVEYPATLSVAADRSRRARAGEAGNSPRAVGAPATTVTSRFDLARWEGGRPTAMIPSARGRSTERNLDEPAPTITAGHDWGERRWVFDRPATTVSGDPRIRPPGHKVNAADLAAGRDHYEGRAGKNAVRVSLEEAAALQSFRPDYPFQGNATKSFMQVGNAIPPLLAAHVLAEATGRLPA